MFRASLAHACCIAALAVTACSDNSAEQAARSDQANQQQTVDINELDPADLPPMIVRSPAYRCDDGKALYVDVLSDENAVMVRDSRADSPTRLSREGPDGAFSGEERTLSGTGSEVRYSSPDRPGQACREAAA